MKLNRKGYMLVEIVLASVLAMVIAYYLLNLTYKFKNTNDDLYQSMVYMKDKISVTKSIMNDIERGTVSDISIEPDANAVKFRLAMEENIESRRLLISTVGATTITYGKVNADGNFDKEDVSYYTKTLEKSLMVGTPSISEKDGAFSIIIPVQALYTDKTYDIRILSPEYHFQPFLLSKARSGSYVDYTGNNGCSGDSCKGQNANYVSSIDKGYCHNSSYNFKMSGWRIGYINDDSAYLVSAGAPECSGFKYAEKVSEAGDYGVNVTQEYYYGSGYTFDKSTGYFHLTDVSSTPLSSASTSGFASSFSGRPYTCMSATKPVSGSTVGACTTMYKLDMAYSTSTIYAYTYTRASSLVSGLELVANLDSLAVKYCNPEYAYGSGCDSNSAWAMKKKDFQAITGIDFTSGSCDNEGSITTCGAGNDLVDNGGYYWLATEHKSRDGAYYWGVYTGLDGYMASSNYGLRPVIRLDTTVMVTGGTGTEDDPYTISNS